jgi:hypothetical protein
LFVRGNHIGPGIIDAQLRLRLTQGAFSARQSEFEFAGVQLDKGLPGADRLAELKVDVADDTRNFARNANLVNRDERSRQFNLSLNGNMGDFDGADVDNLSAASRATLAAALSSSAALAFRALAGLIGRATARRKDEAEEEDD